MDRFVRSSLMMMLGLIGILVTIQTAQAQSSSLFTVIPAQSSIAYTITHPLHTVVGTSKSVEGKVALAPDGTLQVAVRAPIKSFDSHSSGRDEHMQETVEAEKYPYVTFKGVSRISMPRQFPQTVRVNVEGQLDFHGRVKQETIPVEITFSSQGAVHAKARFPISLDKYEIERPSLLLMKINDTCQIALDLQLRRS